ncbi:hypothetical protein QNI19_36070 [Cytophagaceae bacterium DM2B3-1]|uniref:Uncharacterized protein n=1 Tax=Xanthocytophaga flava TaxID=3048013 RepID=A0ABT7CXB1_9BACT|nr:hypothetical protein [Xanthocytophaga flavus]MDJ1498408.1 hypothetical protein [Xanthocytophaga flavus]
MATKSLKNIFLSASIPFKDKERHEKYFDTADTIAIRDSVIALASVVLPTHKLIWGGHPSITPIIYYVIERLKLEIKDHVLLYQSRFFEHTFPVDNNKFDNVVLTDNLGKKEESIHLMREQMFKDNEFAAAVFIGGMEGIEEEFEMFKQFHPKAILLPIASTGAAAKIVYEEMLTEEFKNERLEKDYGYMSLFQNLLVEKL